MTALLELREVTKSFGGVLANDRVSLTVSQGAIVGLIGPNGSGKTTLFNAVTGAFPIDSGSIRFEGREISTLLSDAVARRGIVRTFQQPRVFAPSGESLAHAGSGVDCQATNFQPCGVLVQALRKRRRSVFGWPPTSTCISPRPVTSAVSP